MPLSYADILAGQFGSPGPVYEGGPDANVTPGGVLSALGLGGPSWLDRAGKQGEADWAAYQRGGVPEMMADTGGTQDLAGGFGGTTTGKGIRGFHGTPAEFEKFNTPAYFSTNKEYAGKFAQGGRTIEADLTPQNPWWTQDQLYLESLRSNPENVAALRAKGHDAAIFSSAPGNTDPILQLGGYSYPQIAMFDPAQIARVPQGIRAYHGSDNVARLQKELSDAKGTMPTSNYVVFNPEIVDILKKYGLAGLTMGGVLSAAGQEPAPSQ